MNSHRRRTSFGWILPALPLLAAAPGFGQACQPYWADTGLGLPGMISEGMAAVGDGVFAAGRSFGQSYANVYRWTGAGWIDVSGGLPEMGTFRAVGVQLLDDGSGPRLLAAGWTYSGGSNGTYTYFGAWWTGSGWTRAPAALVPEDGSAFPLISCDLGDGPRIFGVLATGPGITQQLARWTGAEWLAMSDPYLNYGTQLIAFDDGSGRRLYAVGDFPNVGGIPFHGFARWVGGRTWEAPPSNHSSIGTIHDVAAFDDGSGPGLWAYGYVYVNNQELAGVARWNGQTWTGMGGPVLGQGEVWTRSRLAVFDDGSGPALYVTGSFDNWAGIVAHGIVRWDGRVWSAVGEGVGPGGDVQNMVVGRGPYGPAMFVSNVGRAGIGVAHGVAQYVGCPNCYANCDLSTRAPALNVNDFICFMIKFIQQDPYANCTNDAAIDVGDFVCFMSRFAAGCP